MKMEPSFCTAVFWRGGEKIDLNGQKPDAVRCLSVTGERKVNLSFLRDYPNLEELTLMEKCEGVEVLSELKQLHTLSLWLSAPVSWDNVSLPACVFSTCVGKRMATSPHFSPALPISIWRKCGKTEDLAPFPDSSDPASETLSPVTPICAETTRSGWAAFPLCPETL